ncbi:hypothetical protein XU18_3076 [Perkinsela sp. CCAP 1560/4]|nr:hypothetical protein XU18_3076 [Perkinsela sp. CCAP 1560/4]|eukprot:KNH05982.1 hypothetical protein XU18_3076 [Perkinsela sp. CCAP 1560/4]
MNREKSARGKGITRNADGKVEVCFQWATLHVPFDTYAHALCFSGYSCRLISSRGLKTNRGLVDVFPRLATKEILPLEVIWRFPEPPQGLGTGPDPPSCDGHQ